MPGALQGATGAVREGCSIDLDLEELLILLGKKAGLTEC